MLKEQLLLIFDNATTGKQETIRVDDPKPDLEEMQIVFAGNTIVGSGLFGDLVLVAAKIVKITTESMEF